MDSALGLTDLEIDLLNEIFNLGVGNASSSLSQMVKQPIKLSVPEFNVMSKRELIGVLGGDSIISSVSQQIDGPFSAQSFIFFPDAGSLEIVRKLLGDNISDEGLAELQSEAMSEIGNIVLNACIGSLSESLSSVFDIELPVYMRSKPEEILYKNESDVDQMILFIKIELTLSESKVQGYLAFLMGINSFDKLKNILKDKLNKLT